MKLGEPSFTIRVTPESSFMAQLEGNLYLKSALKKRKKEGRSQNKSKFNPEKEKNFISLVDQLCDKHIASLESLLGNKTKLKYYSD